MPPGGEVLQVIGPLKRWRRRRVLERSGLPDWLWEEAAARLAFLLDLLEDEELVRLRELVVLFLDDKSIVGARGFEVTALMRVMVAIQACLPILKLDLDWYEGWENIVIYPDEFRPKHEYTDEDGVVHEIDEMRAGEAWEAGPVLLSWADVQAGGHWHATGMNLVVHEFAHKLDMRNGAVDGLPPLHAGMSLRAWREAFTEAYQDFCARVDSREDTPIDPYAAGAPEEFFAVCSEVFFADPQLLEDEYPRVYAQLAAFYRLDTARRAEALEAAERAKGEVARTGRRQ